MKTNFIFWAISLTLIISTIPSKLLIGLSIYYTFGSLDPNNIESIVKTAVISSLVVFVISSVIISWILSNVYKKLNEKYVHLVGTPHRESYLKDASHLFVRNKLSLKEILFHPIFVLILIISLFLLSSSSALIIRDMIGFMLFENNYIPVLEFIESSRLVLSFLILSVVSFGFCLFGIFYKKMDYLFHFVAILLTFASAVLLKIGIDTIYMNQPNEYFGIRSLYDYSIAISFIYILLYALVILFPNIMNRYHIKLSKDKMHSIFLFIFTLFVLLLNFTSSLYKEITVTNGINVVFYRLLDVLGDSIFLPISLVLIVLTLILMIVKVISKKTIYWMNYVILGILLISSVLLKTGLETIYENSNFYDGIHKNYDYSILFIGVYLVVYSIFKLIHLKKVNPKHKVIG